MKRIFYAFALAALGATTVAAQEKLQAPSFAQAGKLSVCSDPTFPPMEFFQNPTDKEPAGFDIDLVKELGALWGAEPKFVVLDFTGILPGLEAKRCDLVISGATIKPERVKNFAAVPYLNTAQVLLARPDSKETINAYEDLSGKTAAAQAGSTFVATLQKANERLTAAGRPLINIQTYPKGTDVIQQVLGGRVVAGMSLDSEFAWRQIQNPGQLKVLFSDPNPDVYGIYLRRDQAEDETAVRAAVAKLVASGKLLELARKYKLPDAAVAGLGL